MNEIPLVDLYKQYLTVQKEVNLAIKNVIQESAFIGGKYVTEFEKNFADYFKCKHFIGCGNGTDTLEIALKALNIGKNDEVIVPAHTWISTAEAVATVGATPVFVDTFNQLYTIDINKIEEKINSHTKAIIPVHLYGMPADMDKIVLIAKKYSLKIIEDCAQAHGAQYKNKKIGTFGDVASFSFYPGKNLGAYGDAGGLLTNNDELAEKMRIIANHGQKIKHDHILPGRNSRLDGIQAAILTVKLKHLDDWNKLRRLRANWYLHKLRKTDYVLPQIPSYAVPVFHLFVIQCSNRSKLITKLKNSGIQSAVHYPNILPATKAFYNSNFKTEFPISANYSENILSIPLYPELTNKQASKVVNILVSS